LSAPCLTPSVRESFWKNWSAFPTVSRDTNLPLVDWVEGYLGDHGIACHRDYDETGQKASLYAHVGPEVEGGVVLSGHTDVVPVDGQDWDTDPFTVVEKDGKLHGRGTCDMKGFDALAIWAAVEANRRGVTRPLQLCLSRDEEIGCIGAPPMIEHMAGQRVPKAALAIIGEPTEWGIVTGHKGGGAYDIHVHGHEVHSSLPHTGVSAIMEGARLIDWANRVNEENRARASPTANTIRPGRRCMWASSTAARRTTSPRRTAPSSCRRAASRRSRCTIGSTGCGRRSCASRRG
jgi:acetylornithine deacetylase